MNGNNWTYLSAGTGAECVVLLHGGMGRGESYFEYISALEDSFRLIAPDLSASVGTVAGAVAGIAGILDAESVRRVHLFGHSQGGMVAQAFVRALPERTASLVLSNTGLPSTVRAKKVARQLPAVRYLPSPFLRFGVMRAVTRLLATDAPDLTAQARAFWLDYLREMCSSGKLRETALALARLQLDYHRNTAISPAGLAGWPGRVLIFDSDGDTLITRDESSQLCAAYPGAILHTFHETGHLGILTRVESYVVRLGMFWRGAAVAARRASS